MTEPLGYPDDPLIAELLHPDVIARRRRRAFELAATSGREPLTLEQLAEFGGGPWESDEEFEAYLAGIYERRRESRA
jgi:hypothetical protein